jgi:hypothetical protein
VKTQAADMRRHQRGLFSSEAATKSGYYQVIITDDGWTIENRRSSGEYIREAISWNAYHGRKNY